MTLRMIAASAVAAAAALTAAPAHTATAPPPGGIQLTMSKEGPIWGDNNTLIYNAQLANAGPDTATGVIVHVSGWGCEGETWSASTCTRLPDPNDPTKPMDYDLELDPIAPGGMDSFPVTSLVPNESGFVRTTFEVVKSDQNDTNSVPNTCAQGGNPQADCVSDAIGLG